MLFDNRQTNLITFHTVLVDFIDWKFKMATTLYAIIYEKTVHCTENWILIYYVHIFVMEQKSNMAIFTRHN